MDVTCYLWMLPEDEIAARQAMALPYMKCGGVFRCLLKYLYAYL